ncbi:uncharacterized protein [Diadema antillarum]|uniref:uncharacterized protein n=1 Tax=Diadema antillarum TaxID=105358 RepID=UPI003A8553E7
MSSPNETVDTLLVTLASMGFDLDRGQAAIRAGKLSVHEAVEWLLQGGDKLQEIPSRSTPTLSLRPSQGSSQPQDYLPFSLPPVSIPSTSSSAAPPAAPSSPQPPPGNSSEDVKVVSRYSLDDKKREDKNRWEREQRQELSAKYKEERMRKKKAHTQVLREIEEDRKAKQLKTPKDVPSAGAAPSMASPPALSSSASADTASSGSCKGEGAEDRMDTQEAQAGDTKSGSDTPKSVTPCTLQIRLPSGQHTREHFVSDSSLNDVITRLREQHPSLGDNIELLQPFPRKVFSIEELSSSLHQLGLTPSGTLVVRSGSPSQAQAPSLPVELNTGQPPPVPLPEFRAGGRVELMPPPPASASIPQPHQWGRGQAVGGGSESEEGETSNRAAVDEANLETPEEPMREEDQGFGGGGGGGGAEGMAFDEAGLGRRERAFGEEEEEEILQEADMFDEEPPELDDFADLLGGGRGQWPGGRGRGQHAWGEGRRLNDGEGRRFDYGFAQPHRNEEGEDGEEMEMAPSPARIAAAALQRLDNTGPTPAAAPTSPPTEKPVPSLLNLCIKCSCKRLENPQSGVTKLEAVPPNLAEKLLKELKTTGHLRPKTLMMFTPCHLQRLNLDCYKYATNDLMQTVRPHVNLSHLSLASCTFITDQGLQHITSLKKLQQLNLCNNKNLTDKIFNVVKEFPMLNVLLLGGTSVTDDGIETLTADPPPGLSSLNLNETKITDTALLYLARLPIVNLTVEHTQVKTLEHVGNLTHLVFLNVARNRLTKEALLNLHRLPNLKALSIVNIESPMGDEALACLQGLQLVRLSLPDRHTVTDVGLKSIAGMQLTQLDLADFIHVTDEGIHHLADMTTLQMLNLSNTKITGAGMTHLTGLKMLGELHLDRTDVDDEGAKEIGKLKMLLVLSMAATKITDKLLLSGALNGCVLLSKLNLSRTDLTDRGISLLSFKYLELLNLDYTCVSATCANSLTQCPNLKVVRTNNLRNPRVLDQD